MTPEARNWLMLWELKGRPTTLSWEAFCTAPEEVFERLPEEAITSLRAPSALSQRRIMTGRYPVLTITRLIFRTQRVFRVDMHPHFPEPANADRTVFNTYAEANVHTHQLVRRMETEHWNWRQT